MKIRDFFLGRHDHKRIQVTRAIISSLTSSILDYGSLILLVEVFDVSVMASGTIGMVAGQIFIYMAGRFWIFPPVPDGYIGVEITFFIIISVIGAGIHTLVLSLGVNYFPVHYLIQKSIAAFAMFSWNFSMRRITNLLIRNRHRKKAEKAY